MSESNNENYAQKICCSFWFFSLVSHLLSDFPFGHCKNEVRLYLLLLFLAGGKMTSTLTTQQML